MSGGQAGAWALGKEFAAVLRAHPLPLLEGRTGATFCIRHGELFDDSDGPLEWCRPVRPEQAEALAAGGPELTLRTEPAHEEAAFHLDRGAMDDLAIGQQLADSLRSWPLEHRRRPSDLGVWITYLVSPPATDASEPDCDFAVPLG